MRVRDSKLGLIRLRGHGAFTMRITQPTVFLNTIVGRQARYTSEDIQSYLRDVIIARLNDMLGEKLDTILDLPAIYTELAAEFKETVTVEFEKYGLELVDFYISSITPPEEVSKMIDKRSGLEAVGDLDKFLKFELAQGLGAVGGAASAGGGIGVAAGVGMMMPGMPAETYNDIELMKPSMTLPISISFAYIGNTLTLATDITQLKTIIDLFQSGNKSEFLASLKPPIDAATPLSWSPGDSATQQIFCSE